MATVPRNKWVWRDGPYAVLRQVREGCMTTRELKCRVCGYHYRARMTVTDKGPECADKKRCGHNQAQQAKYRRVRHERV